METTDMHNSLRAASSLMTNATEVAKTAIKEIAVGRLEKMDLPHWVLADLKRELQRYDINKGRWKR